MNKCDTLRQNIISSPEKVGSQQDDIFNLLTVHKSDFFSNMVNGVTKTIVTNSLERCGAYAYRTDYYNGVGYMLGGSLKANKASKRDIDSVFAGYDRENNNRFVCNYRKKKLGRTLEYNFSENPNTLFLTLTVGWPVSLQDIKKAFSKFVISVNRLVKNVYGKELLWAYTLEKQPNSGYWHIHSLTNLKNLLPYTAEVARKWFNGGTLPVGLKEKHNILSLWRNALGYKNNLDSDVSNECIGGIWAESIRQNKDSCTTTIAYVTKYITKRKRDKDEAGQRLFEKSVKLKRPEKLINEAVFDCLGTGEYEPVGDTYFIYPPYYVDADQYKGMKFTIDDVRSGWPLIGYTTFKKVSCNY